MSGRPKQDSPETSRRREGTLRILIDWMLFLVAAPTLGFLVWNLAVHGPAAKHIHGFQTWSVRLFLLLCVTLVPGVFLHFRQAWREGLERQGLPPSGNLPSLEEQTFRAAGGTQALIRHCVEQLDRHCRRFYAFHRYQPPYVAYFYYAKKGALSLFGLPLMRVGFLLYFLACILCLSRGDPWPLHVWVRVMLGMGGWLVLSGLVLRLAFSYRKIWVRIVEENNRASLTLSCFGCSKDHWLEEFCNSLELTLKSSPAPPSRDRAATLR